MEFEEHLEAELALARRRWPEVDVDRRALIEAVDARLAPGEAVEVATGWQLAELHLACRCLAGDPAALRALDLLVDQVAVPAAASRGLTRAEIDEVVQALRVRLLIDGREGRPGLTLYTGRGSLGGFIRSSAVRAALNLRRDQTRRDGHPIEDLVVEIGQDPALAHMKELYLEQFRRALEEAWTELDAEQQLFLRHQLDDGFTIDDLARTYRMHRSTAARRLAQARDRLADRTRRNLRRELGLGEVEVDSILRLIRSRRARRPARSPRIPISRRTDRSGCRSAGQAPGPGSRRRRSC